MHQWGISSIPCNHSIFYIEKSLISKVAPVRKEAQQIKQTQY